MGNINDIRLRFLAIARMINGKIVEERDFMDNMDFMKQLGLMPK